MVKKILMPFMIVLSIIMCLSSGFSAGGITTDPTIAEFELIQNGDDYSIVLNQSISIDNSLSQLDIYADVTLGYYLNYGEETEENFDIYTGSPVFLGSETSILFDTILLNQGGNTSEYIDGVYYLQLTIRDSGFTTSQEISIENVYNFTAETQQQEEPQEEVNSSNAILQTTNQLPQVGEDVGGFMGNIFPFVIAFILGIAIIGGITGIFNGVVNLVTKSLRGKK